MAQSTTTIVQPFTSNNNDDLQLSRPAPFTISRKNSMAVLKQSRVEEEEDGDDVYETQGMGMGINGDELSGALEGHAVGHGIGEEGMSDEFGSVLAASDKMMTDEETEKMIQLLCDFEVGGKQHVRLYFACVFALLLLFSQTKKKKLTLHTFIDY
jgi:hypothetical protein